MGMSENGVHTHSNGTCLENDLIHWNRGVPCGTIYLFYPFFSLTISKAHEILLSIFFQFPFEERSKLPWAGASSPMRWQFTNYLTWLRDLAGAGMEEKWARGALLDETPKIWS